MTEGKIERTALASEGVIGASVLLAITASIVLTWSHIKLFWVDELLVLETDSVRTMWDVIRVQRYMPISLDPVGYHLLSHLMTIIFGANAFAIRLPSLLGYLCMQWSIFVFVRRVAGRRSALVAMSVPMLTGCLYYAAEARPYGMLLGVFGLTIISYQAAARGLHRHLALIGLAFGLAVAPNTHYFGVLLYLPVGLAELARILSRRKIDWSVIGAYGVGLLGVTGTLPFQHAVAEFREHYYNLDQVNVHTIPQSYRLMLVNLPFSGKADRNLMLLVFLGLIAALLSCIRLRRRKDISLPGAEWVLLTMLAALPIFGYLLGRFVTHSMEDRYVLGAVLGISALTGISLHNVLRNTASFRIVFALLALTAAIVCTWRIRIEQAKHETTMAGMIFSPDRKTELLSCPDHTIWFEEGGSFQVVAYYEPDPEIRHHLAMFYSTDEEMKFRHRETESLATSHLLHYSTLRFVPYETVKASTGPHIFIVHRNHPWDWSPDALADDGATLSSMGPAFDGEAFKVQFIAK